MAKVRLSHAIVADFLRLIGEGELEPGAQLPPEAALGSQYGVSRSVVREALQALNAKGFIVVRQGSLAAVAPRHLWHVLDQEFLDVTNPSEYFFLLQEAREILEPAMAAVAAAHVTDAAIEEMEDINRRLGSVHGDARSHANLDIAFHDALVRATDNPILVSMHSSIAGLGQRTRAASADVPGAIDRAAQWHEKIIEALRDRDPVSASAAMHLHLRQVRHELQRLTPPVPTGLKEQGTQ